MLNFEKPPTRKFIVDEKGEAGEEKVIGRDNIAREYEIEDGEEYIKSNDPFDQAWGELLKIGDPHKEIIFKITGGTDDPEVVQQYLIEHESELSKEAKHFLIVSIRKKRERIKEEEHKK